jgi:hypothetical protein
MRSPWRPTVSTNSTLGQRPQSYRSAPAGDPPLTEAPRRSQGRTTALPQPAWGDGERGPYGHGLYTDNRDVQSIRLQKPAPRATRASFVYSPRTAPRPAKPSEPQASPRSRKTRCRYGPEWGIGGGWEEKAPVPPKTMSKLAHAKQRETRLYPHTQTRFIIAAVRG